MICAQIGKFGCKANAVAAHSRRVVKQTMRWCTTKGPSWELIQFSQLYWWQAKYAHIMEAAWRHFCLPFCLPHENPKKHSLSQIKPGDEERVKKIEYRVEEDNFSLWEVFPNSVRSKSPKYYSRPHYLEFLELCKYTPHGQYSMKPHILCPVYISI